MWNYSYKHYGFFFLGQVLFFGGRHLLGRNKGLRGPLTLPSA